MTADYVIAGTGSRSLQTAGNATQRAAPEAVTGRLRERLSEQIKKAGKPYQIVSPEPTPLI